ncbi:MAG: hypothetical protein IIT65_05480 [Lachnospiraceae bacterium]|nr:hypothetical protein [Lachnospiraceae bacterium]
MVQILQDPRQFNVRVETLLVKDGEKIKPLIPDEHGYYCGMPLAGIGCVTRNNTYYDIPSLEAALNDDRSTFKRRLNDGCLYGERGHPKLLPGMSDADFLNRVKDISEDNLAVHFRNVYSSEKCRSDGVKLLLGDVKPYGVGKEQVQENFESPYMNTAFSLRSLTKNENRNGVSYRFIRSLITFDWVTMGGYEQASKRYADEIGTECFVEISRDVIFTPDLVKATEISLECFTDNEINEILGTNKVARIVESTTITTSPKQRISRYMSGLNDRTISQFFM